MSLLRTVCQHRADLMRDSGIGDVGKDILSSAVYCPVNVSMKQLNPLNHLSSAVVMQ